MEINDNSIKKEPLLARIGQVFYIIVEKIPFLDKGVRKGGILLKWTLTISFLILVVVLVLSLMFTLMSTRALKKAGENQCKTIAGNISAVAIPLIDTERSKLKRSLNLQDILTGISKSKIPGLEYAVLYDVSGNLAERTKSFAAHTKSNYRARRVPKEVYEEVKNVTGFEEKIITITKKDANKSDVSVTAFQYRMPFRYPDTPNVLGVIEVVFNEESILGPVNQMKLFIYILGGVILVLGIAISIFTAKSMVFPINKLALSMNSVRNGDLDFDLDIKRHDELGELGDEFNTLVDHLREKLQMQKFVSDSTISMIKEKSKKGDIGLGGSRENFAFLFSDIRGFTAMSEKLKPEEVVSILNKYLDLQAQIIKKNEGDIDKFVGDEVMAVFSGSKKVDHAFISAIEIIQAIKKLNAERMKENKITVEVGVGLHIGDVVHGRMGSRDRMDNTSIGDAVNLSSRLCSQADPGTIIVSKEILAKATKGKFMGKKMDPVKVKGKVKPIQIYTITGIKK